MLKYIPNTLTTARILLVAPFLYCFYHHAYPCAFYMFLFASFTDALDGALARYFRWKTRFGAIIDPIADKLLITISFIVLGIVHKIPIWLVVLIIARDLSIFIGIASWVCLIKTFPDFKPRILSKLNTVFQLALVIFALFELAFFPIPAYINKFVLIATTITTLGSYLDYGLIWGKKFWMQVQQ